MAEYKFEGHSFTIYPTHQHPEREGVLMADPGEVIDFGDVAPPDDQQWYDGASGEVYEPPQDVEGDDSAQEDGASDPKAEEV